MSKRMGIFFWSGLRFFACVMAGYFVLIFCLLIWDSPHYLCIWLLLETGSLLLTLFCLGQWGRWRYLVALGAIPICLMMYAWASRKFFGLYNDNLFFALALVSIVLIFYLVKYSYHRWNVTESKDSFASPSTVAKTVTILVLTTTLFYGCYYFYCSVRGHFRPGTTGLWVKIYDWAPEGFFDRYRWNTSIMLFYIGPWNLDTGFWHTSRGWYRLYPKYTNDFVPTEDTGKYNRAWATIQHTSSESPDGQYRIDIYTSNNPEHFFVDHTFKIVGISIVKRTGPDLHSDEDPISSHKYYFKNDVLFACADVCFATSWDKQTNVTIVVYDYGAGVFREDALKSGLPSNYISTISLIHDSKTGRFFEKSQ